MIFKICISYLDSLDMGISTQQKATKPRAPCGEVEIFILKYYHCTVGKDVLREKFCAGDSVLTDAGDH